MSYQTVFPERHPQLLSLTEAAHLCPGWQEECGDEIKPGQELCKTHAREEVEYYQRKRWEADGQEIMVAYPHLTDQE